ncbi:MAG: FAD binding domain-containing protein [Bacteroidota bacterium]|nr:FAD binding domain-containing protein [Bacteroidota bacterium]
MNILECIINNKAIEVLANPGIVVLDFLRQHEHLMGTKEGCREGDCGACTILVGELHGNEVIYKSVNSCLMPLGDAHGKHIVTIEGINQPKELNPIQHAFVEDGGTQCGFCTPGFIMSLTGYCLNNKQLKSSEAIHSVDGNICRCTGHPPIKKAIHHIVDGLKKFPKTNGTPLTHLIEQNILPEYFLSIPKRLEAINIAPLVDVHIEEEHMTVVSGGTDLYVQKAFSMHAERTKRISSWQKHVPITEDETLIHLPGTTTVEEFRLSPVIAKYFPELKTQFELFGSTPIRNRATVAGNIVNASPIGDMTCLLIALNASLRLRDGGSQRTIPLRQFYKGYKQIDKKKSELIESISFPLPKPNSRLSYEKVSRRKYLDIASVNTTMAFELNNDRIVNCGISAGGVGPTPLFLAKTSEYLNGKILNGKYFEDALEIAQTEISPISDARGSAEYKRLLLRQLMVTHCMKYFPGIVRKESLV